MLKAYQNWTMARSQMCVIVKLLHQYTHTHYMMPTDYLALYICIINYFKID